MFFHFQVLVQSLIFFGLLQLIASDTMGEMLSSLTGGGLLVIFVGFMILLAYFYQIAKRFSRTATMTPVPVIFVLSSIGMLYFVQSLKQQFLLIFLSSVAYYFLHLSLYRLRTYKKDQTARGIIAASSVATIFLFYAMAYGIYLNFAINLGILMSTLMLVTALVSYQYFWLISEDKKTVLNYSLVLGLVMAEIVWVLNFWPFGYLTTGVITLIFYYVFWDLIQCHFLGELSKKRVVVNVVVFGFLVALVLTSTRWLPIV